MLWWGASLHGTSADRSYRSIQRTLQHVSVR
jgi:hypothetical protein